MRIPEKFPAYVVSEVVTSAEVYHSGSPDIEFSLNQVSMSDLDEGDVVIHVQYSALNYKDAMASKGHGGVARKFPLVPGIDAVGEVVASENDQVRMGEQVLIAHSQFGTSHCGGFSAFTRVPADWVYRLPAGMTPIEAVTWGTAGFTAAQSVEQLVAHGVVPESGEVLVTGATGGVGIFAIALLAKLGYHVVACSGKTDKHEWLKQQGAAEVISRAETMGDSTRPMLKSRWAGVIDSVGGAMLSSVIRSAQPNACVTACGLVGGNELEVSVYPFILRGVTLCGIDSANVSRETRVRIWNKIASEYKIDVTEISHEVLMENLPEEIEKILAGKVVGRTVFKTPPLPHG